MQDAGRSVTLEVIKLGSLASGVSIEGLARDFVM